MRVHGGIGPQAAILKSDRMYFLPIPFYRVTYVRQTYVPPGTIGVVVAKEGAVPPARPLCEHVESDHFQDGRAFLLNGGQMGRQPAVLHGGASYDINPWIFDVTTTENIGAGKHDLVAEHLKEITVREGNTGVVIALDGEAPEDGENPVGPRIPGHLGFRHPWVFLANGGHRGAQEETLSHGVYAINPWFARIVFIPTRVLILNWRKKGDKDASRYDAALDRITVNVEGHRLSTDMSQLIQIPERAAPALVGCFGESERAVLGVGGDADLSPVQRFVKRVLGRTVEGFFQNTAVEYEVLEFLENHNEVSQQLEAKVRQALAEWDVDAIRVTMNEFEPEDTGIDQFRREIARERDRKRPLEYRVANAEIEARIEKVLIAIARDRGKLATAELEDEIRLLGADPVAFERLIGKLVEMKVPEFIGADTGTLLNMPLPAVGRLIEKHFSGAGRGTGALLPEDASIPGDQPNATADSRSPQEFSDEPRSRRSRVRGSAGSIVDSTPDSGGSEPAAAGARVRGMEKFREQRDSRHLPRSGTDDA
ncbi:SPFH domain-containing protein [Saccharopolyspora gloriosae]|uniref:SPFH domain-containing protein n=1 Tax=Saccharopolyspora gloriosae TaxID=455344 RepID=UPI001FB6E451|nr:SPFH domain-containing protein [Saccharopolyspora gloriosae]